jgi:acetylornithine/succinyldiaminopimelate/putrescine aminotransferase/predicted amino acid dehydrogenase
LPRIESTPGATFPPDSGNNPDLRRLMALCGLERRFVRGRGVWLTAGDGRRFLDAYAQFGTMALGHNAPAVADAVRGAFERQLPAMVQPHEAEQAEALGRALGSLVPGGPRRCVFTTSGAEAVEAAIKLVRAASGRPLILSAEGSFHGRTLGALSLTGQRRHQAGFGPLALGFETVPFGDAGALAERLARDGERIAGYFVEPIQGEGGIRVAPPGYLRDVRELCSRAGVALVVDEIQTGLGRTGTMLALEPEGVVPDVLLLAKALGGGLFPLGACLAREPWWTPRFALGHSSTFANNNVACAVGLAVLDALLKPPNGSAPLVRRAAALGAHLGNGLRALRQRYPETIRDVRGRGLLWGIELEAPSDRDGLLLGYLAHQGLYAIAVAAALAESAAVLTLPTLGSRHVLRLSPPLVIERREVDLLLEAIDSVCKRLRRSGSVALLRGMRWTEPAASSPDREEAAAPLYVHVPTEEPVAPPRSGRRWAFLVHYTRTEDVRLADPALAALSNEETLAVCERASHLPPGVVLAAPSVSSPATGVVADGWLIGLPWLPARMQRDRMGTRNAVRAGVELAGRLGAEVVGLGGFTAPLSDRGRFVVGLGPAITTGNCLTAGMAVKAVEREARLRGADLTRARVGVVGARGSVGALAAKMLARWRPARLLLVGNPASPPGPLRALAERITWPGGGAEATDALDELASCTVVLSASGAACPVLAGVELAPQTIVCDVARPPDAPPELRARPDLAVVDGGLVLLPGPSLSFGPGNLQGLPGGVVLACLAETILHALDGTTRDTGVGDDVAVEDVERTLAMAARHGFGLWSGARAGTSSSAGGSGRVA